MKTHRRAPLRSLLVLLLLCVAADASLVTFSPTSAFPNRYARNVCSLAAASASCQVESAYGTVDGRVRMAFGEANCTVTLRDCVPGVCYSFRDATSVVERDQVPRTAAGPSASLFAAVAATEGADRSSLTNDGFAFRASSKTVTLEYSTHTCHDFYAYRGRVGTQECRNHLAAITELNTGTPVSLGC